MSWAVYFLDFDGRKRIKFTNWRSFNFTRAYNKAGKINIKLDASPTSKRIRAGFDVVVEKNSNRVYYGKIVEKREKDGLIDLVGTDVLGMLDKQNIFKRPTLVSEASEEVTRVLDGLQVAQGVELNANKFIEKTSTSKKWHWENNSILRYIKDIGEQVDNISGFTNNFVFWVDPYYNVWFGQTGTFGQVPDIPINTISLSEDIEQLYNKITVKGNPINAIPYDFDFWTEQLDASTWFRQQATGTSSTADYMHAIDAHSEVNVTNVANAFGDDGAYAEIGSSGSLVLDLRKNVNQLANTTNRTFISASLSVDLSHSNPYLGATVPSCRVYLSKAATTSWCSGHPINSPSGFVTINCTHSQAFASNDFKTSGYYGNVGDEEFKVKIENTSPIEYTNVGGGVIISNVATIKVDHAKYKINYNYTTAGYSTSQATLSSDFANFGLNSLKMETVYTLASGQAEVQFGKRLYSLEDSSTFNMENFEEVRFQYYIDSNSYSGSTNRIQSDGIGSIQFVISDGSTSKVYQWDIDSANRFEAEDDWATKSLKVADADSITGTTDLTNAVSIILSFIPAAVGQIGANIYLDNYYFLIDQYQNVQNDTESQNKYGVREKTFIAREFYSNAECEAVAIILLANLKNPVQKFNITAEGFVDVYPNSIFTFKYDEEEYSKPLVNITYYVNEDGSESMQFTVGDYKRDDLDVILDKFVEINRNADLLKNPYKLA